MIRISAENVAGLNDVRLQLGSLQNKAPAVIKRSLNKALAEAKKEIVEPVTKDYYISAADVRATLGISSAHAVGDSFRAAVFAKGTRRELINFKVNPAYPVVGNNRPPVLRVGVKKAGGARKAFTEAFVQRGKSTGVTHVLRREEGAGRYPAHIKYGPSVPEMLGKSLTNRQYQQQVESRVYQFYYKNLADEIDKIVK